MKTTNKTTKAILAAVCIFLAFNFSIANESRYKLSVENINNISDKALEFDIYLLNTGSEKEELRYSLGQYFLDFNTGIANGGNLTYTIVKSDLPESMRPRKAVVKDNQLMLIVNTVNPDKANLPLISRNGKGTLIATMRLETSADKLSGSPDLKWSSAPDKLRTKIFVYEGNKNVEITNAENNIVETDGNNVNLKNESIEGIPAEFSLLQNYPNPFNPSTLINYELPSSGFVSLKVYDITGKEVAVLVNEILEPGRYSAKFNGSGLASGLYFYRIAVHSDKNSSGDFAFVRKMVLVK